MATSLTELDGLIRRLNRRLRLLEIQGNTGLIKTGLAEDRPVALDLNLSKGTTVSYYATDTKVFSMWNTDTEEWDEIVLT